MTRTEVGRGMIVRTGLTSAFPRSEALVRATRDLDRGRATPEAVDQLYQAAEREVAQLEGRLGLDARTGGYLRWPDLFRPFAESWEGFAVGPLTRWFETNTFYRQPVLLAPPARVPGALGLWLPRPVQDAPAEGRAILPGPYTFAGLLDNRSGEADAAVVHRLGRLLAEEVHELRSSGLSDFVFAEPLLVVRPPEGPFAEATVAAYAAIHGALAGGSSLVWTYGADARPAMAFLDRLRPSAVGVDLAETDPEALPADGHGGGLGLGVVDPRTTLVEDPAEVARIVRTAVARRHPSTVWLGPGGPLDLLPFEPAARKLHVLPAVRQALAGGGRP